MDKEYSLSEKCSIIYIYADSKQGSFLKYSEIQWIQIWAKC
jgi:hypothetical protein